MSRKNKNEWHDYEPVHKEVEYHDWRKEDDNELTAAESKVVYGNCLCPNGYGCKTNLPCPYWHPSKYMTRADIERLLNSRRQNTSL